MAIWTHGGLHYQNDLRRYEMVEKYKEDLQRPYHALAAMLNCKPSEIAVLQSATSAWAQVTPALTLFLHMSPDALAGP